MHHGARTSPAHLAGVLLLLPLAGCSATGDVQDVATAEEWLVDGFLDPQHDAGLPVVGSLCHTYAYSTDDVWQLGTRLVVRGDVDAVAGALAGSGAWVVPREAGAVVQQDRRGPAFGWYGGLHEASGGTTLDMVVERGVRVADPSSLDALRWGASCEGVDVAAGLHEERLRDGRG